jgi:hypothetical protein
MVISPPRTASDFSEQIRQKFAEINRLKSKSARKEELKLKWLEEEIIEASRQKLSYKSDVEKLEFQIKNIQNGAKEMDTYVRVLKNSREGIKINTFKSKMFEKYGLELGNVRAEKAWEMAWERGHSSGEQEVEYYFEELSDLIKLGD